MGARGSRGIEDVVEGKSWNEEMRVKGRTTFENVFDRLLMFDV